MVSCVFVKITGFPVNSRARVSPSFTTAIDIVSPAHRLCSKAVFHWARPTGPNVIQNPCLWMGKVSLRSPYPCVSSWRVSLMSTQLAGACNCSCRSEKEGVGKTGFDIPSASAVCCSAVAAEAARRPSAYRRGRGGARRGGGETLRVCDVP